MRAHLRVAGFFSAVTIVVLFGSSAAIAQTLTTINLDGDMSDWAAVLADPLNVFLDGPAGGLPDADGQVQDTRDIDTVAYTWDANNLYLYIHRQGGSLQARQFWFYLDTDNDGFMADGGPLLRVSWSGLFGLVITWLDTYDADDPVNGDPIEGFTGHDGHALPGDRTAGAFLDLLFSGTANGLEVEVRIPWGSLPIGPGAPFQFHVSASNNENGFPNNIQDNTGGATPVTQPVMTLVKAVDKANAVPSEVLTYSVTYTNTGNAAAHVVEILDPIPPFTTYVPGSAVGAGLTIEFSHDGGFSFNSSEAAPVTHIRWLVPGNLAPGAGGVVAYQVTID